MARGSGGIPRNSRGSRMYETCCWNLRTGALRDCTRNALALSLIPSHCNTIPQTRGGMVDYQKVDPGLAGTLLEVTNPEARALTVFIHTAGTPAQDQAAF